jgi:gamma-glutamyltranspeptidase / glutathione hydrolase
MADCIKAQTGGLLSAVVAASLALLPVTASAQRAPSAPEAATGFEPKPQSSAKRHMIAAANPLAVDAGLAILDAGGSAIDAAIAVQMVLNLVEPQSSGIGGGAFLLHANATGKVVSYDGRETAPAAAKPERFLKADGTPRAFPEAVFGGESVGVPGVLRMLELAHKRHGRLAWSRLFEPAIKLADDGFAVSPRLNKLLADLGSAAFEATARRYFFTDDGKPHAVGHVLKNPAFAATLRAISSGGADALHKGPIADAIVAAVTNAPNHKGDLTLADLAAYQPKERAALCVPYRAYRVCGMGPPSSGGIAIAQMLKLIEPYSLGRRPLNPDGLHLLTEAQKLAYADRDRFVGDPDQVRVPSGLTDAKYLASRRAWIDRASAKPKAEAGDPPGQDNKRAGLDETSESVGTSHVSIVDSRGNTVALTTTIENAFGARIMAAGFLLNNELTDFSFRPKDAAGNPIANAIAPGKRPRSSMAPTIILDNQGRLKAVLGSPGGSRIILYVAKAAVGIMDWGLDAQAAADLAGFGSRNGPLEVEAGMVDALTIAAMTKRGHQVQPVEMTSGLHIIVRRTDGTLEGGADPRREGLAKGR